MTARQRAARRTLTSLQFFDKLKWLDGRNLLSTMQPYRREIFTQAFDTFRADGTSAYNMIVSGRAKKNDKSTDLDLAALYSTVIRRQSLQGNAAFILAADEGQAADNLDLLKKLIAVNPELSSEFTMLRTELRLKGGGGAIKVLPSMHGKTYSFAGFDEIHNARDWSVLEALAPDPTRPDALQWVCSYDTIFNTVGQPLFDLKTAGFAGSDPRMLFNWYSGDKCTDPAFAELPPEQRANPTMSAWPDGASYLEQQRRRLPTHRFRRLHLNLPGAPEGAFLDQAKVLAAIVPGRRSLPPEAGRRYSAFVDMSGGSSDDAVLCIGYSDGSKSVVALLESQAGRPPFDPRAAVEKFCDLLDRYNCKQVWGDAYAGETFRQDFARGGIGYRVIGKPITSASDLYERLEPRINAGEVELLDHSKSQEQLVCLVLRGQKITHESGEHDDYANAIAGLVTTLTLHPPMWITREAVEQVAAGLARMNRRRNDPSEFWGERRWAQMQRRRFG